MHAFCAAAAFAQLLLLNHGGLFADEPAGLRAALDALDAEQRTLVVLRDIEHLSYEELQRVCDLPIGTVKSRLHRARMALHRHFSALQEGPS